MPGIRDSVLTGRKKQKPRGRGSRPAGPGPGRPRGSSTKSSSGRRGRGRGLGRPPLNGAEVLRKGRKTTGKKGHFPPTCHLCQGDISDDDEEISICGCDENVHSDCYRMDGCEQ